MKHIEVEVKYSLPDPASLIERLAELDAVPSVRTGRSIPISTHPTATSSPARSSQNGCGYVPKPATIPPIAHRSTSSGGSRSAPRRRRTAMNSNQA